MQKIITTQTKVQNRRSMLELFQHKTELPGWQRHWRQIDAILPIYLPDDINGTIIYFDNGQQLIVENTCSYSVEQLLQHLTSSIDVLQNRAEELLGVKKLRRVPLLHTNGLCLMPVKSRKPQSKSDAASGYIVVNKIANIYKSSRARYLDNVQITDLPQNYTENATIIAFESGLNLKIMDSLRTVDGNISLCLELMERKALIDAEELAALDKGELELMLHLEQIKRYT